jgi:transcriptional regulator with XRE-family HTH domain
MQFKSAKIYTYDCGSKSLLQVLKLIKMDLSDKLYIARKLLDLNQNEAAEKAGLNQTTISILERGERNNLPNPYIHFLYQNGIDLNWLFNNDNDIANVFLNRNKLSSSVNLAGSFVNSAPEDEVCNVATAAGENSNMSGETTKNLNKVCRQLLQEIEKLNAALSKTPGHK